MSVRELIAEHLDLWAGAVTKKSSSGRGSNRKVELTGIKKLRELILQLAVTGRLIEQDMADESAKTLLEKVDEEITSLVKEGRINRPTAMPPVAEKDRFCEIPYSWQWVKLGSLALHSEAGWSPKCHDTPREMPNWAVLKVSAVTWGQFRPDENKELPENLSPRPELEVQPSDFLISRANTSELVARSVVVPAEVPKKLIMSDKIIRFVFSKQVFPPYLNMFNNGPFARSYYLSVAGGTSSSMKNVSRAQIQALAVPLPPLEEQHRIVQKVDELMALCDHLEQQTSDQLEAHETLVDTLLGTLTQSDNATELADNWARLATHFDTLFTTEQSIDKLKQTILQLAVMGRLVEQDGGDEPTCELLERLSNKNQRLIKSKLRRAPKSSATLDTSKLPVIPESWSWANLSDIISLMDAGWSPECPSRPAEPDAWGVLKTTAVQVMEYLEFENKELPDGKEPKEQYEVRSGDILITRAGPKNRVGISCVVRETRDKLMISDKIIRFHLIEEGLSEEYICICLSAGETYRYLEQAKSGMAESQMNISQDKLKAAPIPLCPPNEQHRIVQKVNELVALCDQLKERLNQAGETRCQFAEATLAEVVHGSEKRALVT